MATFAKQSSCFFFATLLIICCLTEARESKFFSKYINLSKNTNKNYATLLKDSSEPLHVAPQASAPITSHISDAPTPLGLQNGYAPAPLESSYAPAPLESENSYYGLYAKDNTDFPSETNSIVDDRANDELFSNEELGGEGEYPKGFENGESTTLTGAYSNNLNENNGFWTSNHEGYYKSEPQGMSDTRVMEDGKYYYNVGDNENYVSNGKNHEGGDYYGYNEKSKYEFDSMEEYEKQEGYPDVQVQEFIP